MSRTLCGGQGGMRKPSPARGLARDPLCSVPATMNPTCSPGWMGQPDPIPHGDLSERLQDLASGNRGCAVLELGAPELPCGRVIGLLQVRHGRDDKAGRASVLS